MTNNCTGSCSVIVRIFRCKVNINSSGYRKFCIEISIVIWNKSTLDHTHRFCMLWSWNWYPTLICGFKFCNRLLHLHQNIILLLVKISFSQNSGWISLFSLDSATDEVSMISSLIICLLPTWVTAVLLDLRQMKYHRCLPQSSVHYRQE